MKRLGFAVVLSLFIAASAHADTATVEANSNATVRPSGPRTGSNGLAFYNIEGASYGVNASYGIARFNVASVKSQFDTSFGPNNWQLQKIEFTLRQQNSAFTLPGGVRVLFTADDSTVILNDGTAPPALIYTSTGDHLNGLFTDAGELTTYMFNHTGIGGNDTLETYTLYDLSVTNPQAALDMRAHFCATNTITLIQTESSDPAVAATYAGYTHSTSDGPTLIFTAVAGPGTCGANHIPVTQNYTSSAPYTAGAGGTCTFNLTAEDSDGPNPLTFSVTGGSLAGSSITLNGGPTNNAGVWTQSVTYHIPAAMRGRDVFSYTVSDGTSMSSAGTITILVRGPAGVGAVAFGTNSGSVTDAMRVYNGTATPNGGTEVNFLGGVPFAESAEFDNLGGLRHNPAGNLLALDFGGAPNGPGSLIAYRANATCNQPDGTSIFTFSTPSVMTGPTRVVGLSVSPNNSKLAVYGFSNDVLYILAYNGTVSPPTAALDHEIDLTFVIAGHPSVGTTWLDDDHLLILDTDCNVVKITVSTGDAMTLAFRPSPTLPTLSQADIEYNPEVSPYIFVSIGTFVAATSTNTLYVCDVNGNIISQANDQLYTDYSNPDQTTPDETFREIGFDAGGNLFFSTFVNTTRRVNVKYLPNAASVGNIQGGYSSLVNWHTLTAAEGTTNFVGMDVAAATTIPGNCSLRGDLNLPTPDGIVNGVDIPHFTSCYIASFGQAPAAGCTCADVNASGTIDQADLNQFVQTLLGN